MFCDLHLHSDRSDGTVPPHEVVRLAKMARMTAIALTDHDTVEGVAEAQEAGERLGVRVVAGVELSLEHEPGTFHLIALGVDPDDAVLGAAMARIRDSRDGRNARIAEKLQQLGVDVTIEEVEAAAGDGVTGRPHFASVMIGKGYVTSVQAAFDQYLARGAPAYVHRFRLSLAEAVAAVHHAGGATVLCHPFTLGFDQNEPAGKADLNAFLADVTAQGLDAIEVRYGSYSRKQERFWEGVARGHGLLFSGGSDFHGARKPAIHVGHGKGRMRVPAGWLDVLLDRAASRG